MLSLPKLELSSRLEPESTDLFVRCGFGNTATLPLVSQGNGECRLQILDVGLSWSDLKVENDIYI